MEREVFNPKYEQALRRDPTLGMPLFEQQERRRVPPATVKKSATRSAAYRDARDSGMIRGMQLRILALIKSQGPLTRQEVSDILHIPVHVVSGRICELHAELGEIEIAVTPDNPKGKKLNPKTNKWNTSYRVASNV